MYIEKFTYQNLNGGEYQFDGCYISFSVDIVVANWIELKIAHFDYQTPERDESFDVGNLVF